MANPEHLETLKRGVTEWNKWREEHAGVTPDLRGADLGGVKFSEAHLSGVDFTGANLSNARLEWADLGSANLCGTDLHKAILDEANLGRARLAEADLTEASLVGVVFRYANLREANLSRANLLFANFVSTDLTATNFSLAGTGTTSFGNVDLSTAKGLEIVQHAGPSIIGIDTIYKSGGKIPEVFLRGCGVSDQFIAYIDSLIASGIKFYSCFISYSTHDQEFAERLHADLQAKGVRCWFAPHDIKGGRKIHEQIDEAIRLHDRLLLILSEHSMSSEGVKSELAKARKREVKEGKRVLFPVRLVGFERLRDWECFDGHTGKDSAREIREYFIPDFSSWNDHDSYQKAFGRLVGDLKAEASK